VVRSMVWKSKFLSPIPEEPVWLRIIVIRFRSNMAASLMNYKALDIQLAILTPRDHLQGIQVHPCSIRWREAARCVKQKRGRI